jgi:hypothetical protein
MYGRKETQEDYEDETVSTGELVSPCKKCGECCRWLAFKIMGLSPETIEYLKARGAIIDDAFLILNQPCQHLTEKNLCDIHYQEGYPLICRRYHGHGRYYIPNGCVYATPSDRQSEEEMLAKATKSAKETIHKAGKVRREKRV